MNNERLFFVLLLFLIACKQSDNGIQIKNEYYKDGHLKSQTTLLDNQKDGVQVNFYYSGGVKSVLNYLKGKLDGEQVFFYDNGFVEQKFIIKNGLKNGFWYYYYSSGAMKSSRYCKNGMEVLYCADYWNDTLNLLKSSLHFNDSGQIYFKRNYDVNGNFTNQEGKR
jgi:antitoxin component YwqK of YwqJK toxin-antitoxin module